MRIRKHFFKFTCLSASFFAALMALSPEVKAQNNPEFNRCVNDCRNDLQKCTGTVRNTARTDELINDYCTKNVAG